MNIGRLSLWSKSFSSKVLIVCWKAECMCLLLILSSVTRIIPEHGNLSVKIFYEFKPYYYFKKEKENFISCKDVVYRFTILLYFSNYSFSVKPYGATGYGLDAKPPTSNEMTPSWQGRSIAGQKLRLVEFSAYIDQQREGDQVGIIVFILLSHLKQKLLNFLFRLEGIHLLLIMKDTRK